MRSTRFRTLSSTGNPAFGVEFAQRYMEGPLILAEMPQTIGGETQTFADTNSGRSHKQQGIGFQVIGLAELILQ